LTRRALVAGAALPVSFPLFHGTLLGAGTAFT
jgi:hypothetical protein